MESFYKDLNLSPPEGMSPQDTRNAVSYMDNYFKAINAMPVEVQGQMSLIKEIDAPYARIMKALDKEMQDLLAILEVQLRLNRTKPESSVDPAVVVAAGCSSLYGPGRGEVEEAIAMAQEEDERIFSNFWEGMENQQNRVGTVGSIQSTLRKLTMIGDQKVKISQRIYEAVEESVVALEVDKKVVFPESEKTPQRPLHVRRRARVRKGGGAPGMVNLTIDELERRGGPIGNSLRDLSIPPFRRHARIRTGGGPPGMINLTVEELERRGGPIPGNPPQKMESDDEGIVASFRHPWRKEKDNPRYVVPTYTGPASVIVKVQSYVDSIDEFKAQNPGTEIPESYRCYFNNPSDEQK